MNYFIFVISFLLASVASAQQMKTMKKSGEQVAIQFNDGTTKTPIVMDGQLNKVVDLAANPNHCKGKSYCNFSRLSTCTHACDAVTNFAQNYLLIGDLLLISGTLNIDPQLAEGTNCIVDCPFPSELNLPTMACTGNASNGKDSFTMSISGGQMRWQGDPANRANATYRLVGICMKQ